MQDSGSDGDVGPVKHELLAAPPALGDYPVREYVGSMAQELAHMARWDGDDTLACALDIVVELSRRPWPDAQAGDVKSKPDRPT